MDEKIILKNLKNGSREALALLWQSHSVNVLNLAFRTLKDRDMAEDILMDVFVQIPSAIQKFRGECALNTWLFRLTLNTCFMKLRANKRHRELEQEQKETIIEESLGSTMNINVLHTFDSILLEKALNELSYESRSMLWLKDVENLDIKEIAGIYNMKEGTIKARLSRSRNFIKNYLKEKLNQ